MNASKRFWLIALMFVIAAVSFTAVMGVLFWDTLSVAERAFFTEIVPTKYMLALCCPLLLGLLLAINAINKSYVAPLGRLAEETTLITKANSLHRINISGGRIIKDLATLINEGADHYVELERNVKERISQAKAQVEEEKNTLAAFIAELSEGVVICNPEGIILLYNKQAKDFFTQNDSGTRASSPYIGLGRSVFGLIEKNVIVHALDEIIAKLQRKDESAISYFVVVGSNNRQLKTEAVPIIDAEKQITGFILIVYDITRQLERDRKVDMLLKSLTDDVRASLGGIRAAIEAIIDFPDMDRQQLSMFKDIIHKESMNLSARIETTEAEYSDYIQSQWPLIRISATDLIEYVRSKAKQKLNLSVAVSADAHDDWVEVDSYSLSLALLFLLHRINEDTACENFSCSTKRERKFVCIDLTWTGRAVKIEHLDEWEHMALVVNDEYISHSLEEVIKHHEAKVTPYSLPDFPESSALRVLLPSSNLPTVTDTTKISTIRPHEQPTLYDFDLFNQPGQNPQLDNTPLAELVYTVFDTETTGLDPSGGDEIISLGALRIVNLRILHEEMIDQLIDPKRSLPRASIEIHGIQPEMLVGQPLIDTVLPQFFKFCEQTILVGHNAAFDMAMFKAKEKQTGVSFPNPVLDTLILSAVVHPEQDNHSIEAIAARLGVSIVGRHSAYGDALTTAEMFLKIVPLLAGKGIHTLKQAREASQKTFYAKLKY